MNLEKKAAMFSALSHPNRLELFLKILQQEEKYAKTKSGCIVSDIVGSLSSKIGAPTISHHIKELAAVGLVKTSKEGKYLICTVDQKQVAEIQDFFNNLSEVHC